jgi:1,3-beta-glucan synthase
MKQSKLRRRRVIRYAVLYFALLAVFVGLLVAPTVVGDAIPEDLNNSLNFAGFRLVQPNGENNNNTNGTSETGTAARSNIATESNQDNDRRAIATEPVHLYY